MQKVVLPFFHRFSTSFRLAQWISMNPNVYVKLSQAEALVAIRRATSLICLVKSLLSV
jgi:hypothetical protein